MSRFEAGDIILTYSPGWLSRAIRWVTSVLPMWRGERVPFSHAAIVVDPQNCIEALNTVRLTPLSERLSTAESVRYLVIRPQIPDPAKFTACYHAKKLVGTPYSYWRLALFLLDDMLNTRFFGKLDRDPNEPVCSELVAWCYRDFYKFGGLDWTVVAPQDIEDDFRSNPDKWKVVAEK